MLRSFILALVLCSWLGALSAQAQQSPTVSARLSEGIVKLGARVTLIIEVEGAAQASVGELPTLDGLVLTRPGPPNSSSFISFINGRRSMQSTLTFGVPIKPEKKGDYKLPPIEVQADGRTLRTPEQWLRVVEDLAGEQLGQFEIQAPATVIEGQPFTIELRFGWDLRQKDINYGNLSLPWYPNLGGLIELDAPKPDAGMGTMAGVTINAQGNYTAEQLPKEGEFLVLRLRRRFLATRSGALEFPISHFEFGSVSQDFLLQREKRAYYKRVPGFTLNVIALPEEGRPLDYSGAVGTLRAQANADRRDVDVGDSIKLSVEWRGDGNLEFFDVPELDRLEEFRSFRYFGKSSERKTSDRRSVTFDIAPLHDKVVEIPPVPLSVFDPSTMSYHTVRTQPIAIRVRPLENAVGLSDPAQVRGPSFDIRDIDTLPAAATLSAAPGWKALATACLVVLLGWLGLRRQVRLWGDPASPKARARRRALRELERALPSARDAAQQLELWQAFLASRTGTSSAAWIGRGPEGLGQLPAELIEAWTSLQRELEQRAYGGLGGSVEAARIVTVARRCVGAGL